MPDNDPQVDAERIRLHLLVLRCQAGDERAFARLFDEFQAKTLGYLRGIVGDVAEDVQQDVWLSVYRNLSGLASPGAFRTWLFRVTRHAALTWSVTGIITYVLWLRVLRSRGLRPPSTPRPRTGSRP